MILMLEFLTMQNTTTALENMRIVIFVLVILIIILIIAVMLANRK